MASPVVIRDVCVFFHDDRPDGLAFSYPFPDGPESRKFSEWCESTLPELDATEDAPGAIRWLETTARRVARGPVSRELGVRITLTVHWLERRGHIASNEHNGVMWIGTQDGAVVCLRHDPPIVGFAERMMREHRVTVVVEEDRFESKLREILGTPPAH